ncbi:MAG: hypothetical protein AABZ61_11170, partial [Bacteroidota bacterium]
GKLSLSLKDQLDALVLLKQKAAEGKRIGTFGKMLLSANCKQILDTYLIDGQAPDTSELIEVLQNKLLIEQAQKDIKTLLSQGFAGLKSSLELEDEADTIQLEVLMSGLSRVASYGEDYIALADFCRTTKELVDFSYTNLEDVEHLIAIIASDVSRVELVNLEQTFKGWVAMVLDSTEGLRHPLMADLVEAIEKRSIMAWKKAIGELAVIHDKQEKSIRLQELAIRIREQAPNLYGDMVGLANSGKAFRAPDNLALAWKVGRLEAWLDEVHDRVDIDSLQAQFGRLTKKEETLNSELVTILAWQRQIDKVTKIQRDALMAWSDAMKKYGKGKGKYANTWLRSAQEALKEAKSAVPVWIMPLHRVAQMF